MAQFAEVALDLGTGDGRFVLATAAAWPDALVIGVDADAAGMADASRRAGASSRKGGLSNALFVAAGAAALPAELDGAVSTLTVHFPWGSLLRGLLEADPVILGGIVRICRPGAGVTVLLSVTERDHVTGFDRLGGAAVTGMAEAYAAFGLALADARPATAADIEASHSTWAKRLGAGAGRPAWLVRYRLSGPSYPGRFSEGRSIPLDGAHERVIGRRLP